MVTFLHKEKMSSLSLVLWFLAVNIIDYTSGFRSVMSSVLNRSPVNNLLLKSFNDDDIKRCDFDGKGCVLISCLGEFNHFLMRVKILE